MKFAAGRRGSNYGRSRDLMSLLEEPFPEYFVIKFVGYTPGAGFHFHFKSDT